MPTLSKGEFDPNEVKWGFTFQMLGDNVRTSESYCFRKVCSLKRCAMEGCPVWRTASIPGWIRSQLNKPQSHSGLSKWHFARYRSRYFCRLGTGRLVIIIWPSITFRFLELCGLRGSRDGTVVRALFFHLCGRVLNVGWVWCWFSPCSEGFSPGFPVFLPPQEPTSPNCHSSRTDGNPHENQLRLMCLPI